MAEQYIFTIENLIKAHGKREVLKNIWLAFYPGAKIGVIGGNGAGKSSLIKIMAGVGGSMIGYSRGQLSVDSFGVFVGLGLLATGYLAAITSASGGLVAGFAGYLGISYTLLDRHLNFGKYYTFISGLGLLMTVLFNPMGIAGKTRADFDRLRAKRAAKRRAAAASARVGCKSACRPGCCWPTAPFRSPPNCRRTISFPGAGGCHSSAVESCWRSECSFD